MNQEKRDYCLNCIHKPCQLNGCPIQNRIPEFIKETLLSKGDKSDYFSIISAVFYLENNDKNLTKEIINIIFQKIKKDI